MEEEEGRLGAEEWASFEHPDLKLISIIAERDAALLERNAAFAEKKAACTERDAALLQRDLAYSDRNSAIMERDAALAALEHAKSGHLNGRTDVGAKVLQVLAHNSAFAFREAHQNPYPLAPTSTATVLEEPQKQIKKKEGQKRKLGISTAKAPRPKKQRKQAIGSEEDDSNLPLVAVKHEWKVHDRNNGDDDDGDGDGDGDDGDENIGVSIDASAMHIPACSCTGVLQQCYRWGNGGWQSACCTNNVSMYPLPMNPKKKGARVPGRKMSGGAFKKLLRRLSAEGLNFPQPIDLKNHWARHGTNRYVTIK